MIAIEGILVIICLIVFVPIIIKEFNNYFSATGDQVPAQNGTEPQQFAQPQFAEPQFQQNYGQQQFAQSNYGQQQFWNQEFETPKSDTFVNKAVLSV